MSQQTLVSSAMSQTADPATAPSTDRITGADPAQSLEAAIEFFEELVWHDWRTCSNCFALMKRDYWAEGKDESGKYKEIEESWRTADAELGYVKQPTAHDQVGERTVRDDEGIVVGTEARDEHGHHVAHLPRSTCSQCGSVRGLRQFDTLSVADALDRVPRLVERLRIAGYAVDERAVRAALERIKREDRWTQHDKECFAVAAALGVSKA